MTNQACAYKYFSQEFHITYLYPCALLPCILVNESMLPISDFFILSYCDKSKNAVPIEVLPFGVAPLTPPVHMPLNPIHEGSLKS